MYSVIILAAGKGTRLGLKQNKVFYEIKGKPVLEYSLDYFSKDQEFLEIILVYNQDDFPLVERFKNNEKIKLVKGGKTRQESVYLGLEAVRNDYVFIHDGARPFIDKKDIDSLKLKVKDSAVVLARAVKEALALKKDAVIESYQNRNDYILLQTPQAFLTKKLSLAYESARKNHHQYDDDASLYLSELGEKVKIIDGNDLNIKLTTVTDLKVLEKIL